MTITVSNHPQLFLDDYMVARMDNVARQINQPIKHEANPVIVQELPWEKCFVSVYGTVIFDEHVGKYRCWYNANQGKLAIPDTPEGPGLAKYYICYAESDDGINWRKPMVGQGRFASYGEHNIVVPEAHGMCVLPEPDDPDPARRYKGFGGRTLAQSPDGIRWQTQIVTPREVIGKNDTSSCVIRWKGEYLAYVRYQAEDPDWPGVMRGVGISVSQDFEQWTPKQLIWTTDKDDGYPWSQPYGLAVTPYGDQLIGIVWFIHLDKIEGNNSVGGQDAQLLVSREGRDWQRVADRATFLAPTPDTWDRGRIFPATTMFVKNDKVYIYYTGSPTRHGEGKWGATGIGLATIDADRFVSVRRARANGVAILETPPLKFSGKDLLVNAAVEPDNLAVGLLDQQGNELAGFGAEQSHLVAHDELRYRVVWRNGENTQSLAQAAAHQPLTVRFCLSKGDLYAFEVFQ